MRHALSVRRLRRSQAALGVLIVGIPVSAGVFSAGRALADTVAAPASFTGALSSHVNSHRLAYGEDVVVYGSAPSADSGRTVQLQFAPAHSTSWSALATGSVASNGSFRLAAPLVRSGQVRAVAPFSGGQDVRTATASAASSPSQAVSVRARLHVAPHASTDLGTQSVDVRGRLLPGLRGRKVRLEGRSGGGWTVLSVARTGAGGRFDLRYTPSGPGHQDLRVRFAGDAANAWAGAHAGQLTVFTQTVASWYNDAGNTACGFHAVYGVANRTLPCGTKVTFENGGRTVTATVDDRGPYVGGRDWDLNQNTASALGFGGVGALWASL
jgi:peptidoglycan lytic transglycosylase